MRTWFSALTRWDWPLQLSVFALTCTSLLVIYGMDVSRGHGLFQFQKQLTAALIGLVISIVVARIDYRRLRSLGPVFGVLAIGLLLMVLPFGARARTVGRFSFLGTLTFQPVELVKVLIVLTLGWYLARHMKQHLEWIPFFGSSFLAGLCAVLVFLQPDFGSAIVVLVIWAALVFFCGLPRHAWWIGLVIVTLGAGVSWAFLFKPYQKERILTFMNPQVDPLGAGYNVLQARIAVGSGGWLGKGIGQGSQTRLRYLPESSTDFWFAVLGEETGMVGMFLVLSLFAILFWRIVLIAMSTADPYANLICVGFGAMMLFHVLVNVGMNIGIMPVTGIPLPFCSAGASSVISLYLAIGIIQSIAVERGSLYDIHV